MKTPNEHGCYEKEALEDVARKGRAFAAVYWCHCDDGLYRVAVSLQYSYGGHCGPISASTPGYATAALAKEAGIAKLLQGYPKAWASDPQSVHNELAELRQQIERQLVQPSLF